MTLSEGPQGEGELGREGVQPEVSERVLPKEVAQTIFQNALARRLVEIIMRDGLLTSTYDWYEELMRVHSILSKQDSLLRRIQKHGQSKDNASDAVGPT